MKPSHSEFQQRHPMRPVDWRWRHAAELCALGRHAPRRFDDESIREAVHFLRRQRRCQTERQSARLARQFAEVHDAIRLRQQDDRRRTVVEARLLAGESPATIAQELNVTVAAIEMFENLFFNVRDRRSATDWIVSIAIGRIEAAQDEQLRRERFIKWVAYSGGPEVLHTALQCLGFPVPSRTDDCSKLAKRFVLLETLLSETLPPMVVFRIAENCRDIDSIPSPELAAGIHDQTFDLLAELLDSHELAAPSEGDQRERVASSA